MKVLIISLMAVCFLSVNTDQLQAQTTQKKTETVEFHVNGVCGACKNRIEKAALIKGVKMATWDKSTGMLKVVFNNQKVTENDIHKSVAASGHDTEKETAPTDVYQNLPACCAYRDGVAPH